MEARAPALAARLREVTATPLLISGPGGTTSYRRGPAALPLSVPRVELSSLGDVEPEVPVFLFGVGLGEVIAYFLREVEVRPIIAWDREPQLLVAALSRVPMEAALRSGRLTLLCGPDLLDRVPLPADAFVVRHPLLDSIYIEERLLLAHPLKTPAALVVEGGLLVPALEAELGRRGFGIYPLSPSATRREHDLLFRRVRPQLVVAINYIGGLAELCAAHDCKLLCWEIDPPPIQRPRPEGTTDHAFLFAHRPGAEAELRATGFRHAEHLPLAPSLVPRAISAEERAPYAAPVSFVGTSMVGDIQTCETKFLEACRSASRAPESGLLAEALAAQRAEPGRWLLPQWFAARCADWPEAVVHSLVRLASEIASAERRVRYVGALGRFGVEVWGDPGWRVAKGVRYRGFARNYIDLQPIYEASQINVDIGRLHQLDIVTLRVFDILACGGFLLAEQSAELGELFDLGREIDSYRSLEELEDKVAFYLAHPEQAQTIAEAGRAAVNDRHSLARRVDRMLAAARP